MACSYIVILRLTATLSQIYPHWNWNSKLNTKHRLEFQFECGFHGFKLEFQVELLIRWESVIQSFSYLENLLSCLPLAMNRLGRLKYYG